MCQKHTKYIDKIIQFYFGHRRKKKTEKIAVMTVKKLSTVSSLFKILKFDTLNIFKHLESMSYYIVEIVNTVALAPTPLKEKYVIMVRAFQVVFFFYYNSKFGICHYSFTIFYGFPQPDLRIIYLV